MRERPTCSCGKAFRTKLRLVTHAKDTGHEIDDAYRAPVPEPVKARVKPALFCPYCAAEAVLIMSSAELYSSGRDYGPAWVCRPCRAWVGCHPRSTTPLGRLANAELRAAKIRAHAAFDPLWRSKMAREGCQQHVARGAGYAWLADRLGMPRDQCHIGMFDVAECDRVVALCCSLGARRDAV